MQIAQVLAGYTLGGADLLRRAMGKKIQAEMDAQRAAVRRRARRARRRASAGRADLRPVAKFAGYGFNKSHAAAYALVAYQTAWLKANHPVEFFAASMTLDLGNTDKLNLSARSCDRLGIALLPPDINRSEVDFSVEAGPKTGKPRHPLCAGRSQGRRRPGDERPRRRAQRATGRFKDLFDFAAPARRQQLQQAPVREPGQSRRLRQPQPEPRARASPPPSCCCATPAAPPRSARAGRSACSAAIDAACRAPVTAGGRRLAADRAAAARVRGDRLLSLRPSARRLWQQPGAAGIVRLATCRRPGGDRQPRGSARRHRVGRKERTSARATASPSCSCRTCRRHVRGDGVLRGAGAVARPARQRAAAAGHRRRAAARRTACA